jgi:hypothetical protein
MRLLLPLCALRACLAAALLLALAPPAQAQFAEGGPRALALGRAGAALGAQTWGHANPAAWAGVDGRRAALHGSQAYGLPELRLAALSLAAPTPAGTATLAARSYGFAEHRETRVQLGLARTLALSRARGLDAGLALGYESATTEGVGTVGTVLLAAGVQADLLPALRGGLAARNLLGLGRGAEADLRRSAATVPAVTVGVAYAASGRALLALDAEQDAEHGLSVRAGLEARPADALALRAGVSTGPVRFAFGAGVAVGALRADLAVERHEALGLTPAVGLEVAF